MDRQPLNILFLCTGNSARSILAEALANHLGEGRFRAFSAGSQPAGRVQPLALEVLAEAGIPVEGLASKSWDAFAGADAPPIDIVITVCGRAAGETCPVWPGSPVTAHWGVEDPVTGEGEQDVRRFRDALNILRHRVRLLASLKPEALQRLALKPELDRIGLQSP